MGLGVFLSGKCVVPKGVVFWIAVRDGARSYLRPVRPHGTFHPAQRNVHPQLHPVAEPVAFVFPSFDSFWVSLSWGPRSRACSTAQPVLSKELDLRSEAAKYRVEPDNVHCTVLCLLGSCWHEE